MTAEPVAPPAPADDLPGGVLTSVGVEVQSDNEGSRWYVDPWSDRRFASVTTIIGMNTSKPWLVAWGAKLAAEYAVERHDLIAHMLAPEAGEEELPETFRAVKERDRLLAAIDHVKREGARRREAARDTGTWVHDVIEALVLDTALPVLPPEVEPFAEAFVDWHCAWNPRYIMAEATVCNRRYGYAGTADIVAYLPALDRTCLIDAKSGANLDLEMPIQLTAYAEAEEVWLPFGRKAKMPRVDMAAVLHLRPEGAKLIDVPLGGDHFSAFLRMLELTEWRDAQPKRMGRVIYPPLADGTQPPPLLEDIDMPCRAILADAGVTRLDHLTDMTGEKLLGLKGIGAKKLEAIRVALAAEGAALAGEDVLVPEQADA